MYLTAFLQCSDAGALQQIADSLSARDLVRCGQKWLARLTPFFTESKRQQAGVQHRLFFAQVTRASWRSCSNRPVIPILS